MIRIPLMRRNKSIDLGIHNPFTPMSDSDRLSPYKTILPAGDKKNESINQGIIC